MDTLSANAFGAAFNIVHPIFYHEHLIFAHEKHEMTRMAEELPTEHTDYTEESDVVEFRI